MGISKTTGMGSPPVSSTGLVRKVWISRRSSFAWVRLCERENLLEALRRVKANKGSAGIDGMTVGQLSGYLKEHWLTIREQLLNGTYEPQPVRRVEIEKPDGGGMRKLGIPTTLDRFLQQAVLQVLQRRWDPQFS